jgi:tetratricopeptide (TPR) repeat protein
MEDDAVEASYRSGMAALAENRLDDAWIAFKRVLDLRPTHANAMYRMGEIEHRRGLRAEAAWFYIKTLDLDPEHVSARAQLARLNPEPAPANGNPTTTTTTKPGYPASDLYLPRTEEEFQSFDERLRRKRRIEWWAGWSSRPAPLRVVYVLFAAVVLSAFVAVMVLVVAQFPG